MADLPPDRPGSDTSARDRLVAAFARVRGWVVGVLAVLRMWARAARRYRARAQGRRRLQLHQLAARRPAEDAPLWKRWGTLAVAGFAQRRLAAPHRRSRWRWVRRAAAAVGVLVAVALAIPLFGFADEAIALAGERFFGVEELPDIDRPSERSILVDAADQQVAVLSGPENRDVVELDVIPQVLVDAVLSTEDAGFYDHEGVQPLAIVRAAIANLTSGSVEQGASTLTQQYVKNALLTNERSLERKVTEATWAIRLEEELDKDEILARYLNIAYFGNGAYGVNAASERYFGVPVAELDLPRAAVLAGIVQRPEALNPIADPAAATRRRDVVLSRMVATGAISADEAEAARVPLESILQPTEPPDPPHEFFLEYVKHELLAAPELGETREARADKIFGGGLTIRTALDVRRQAAAEQVLRDRLPDPATDPLGAIVSIHPATGAIRTMAVGPKTFGTCEEGDEACTKTKVNPLAAGLGGSGRQPGSAFKPIVLAAALAEEDVDTSWHTSVSSGQSIEGCGNYRPDNYDRSGGIDDMVEAITESNNVFHVKLAQAIGQERVVEVAKSLGIDTELAPTCSLPLGSIEVFPLDMAEAYATFANRGVHCEPFAVLEVLDRDGETILKRQDNCERVMDEEDADTIAALLRRVVDRGTARRADIRSDVAAKTGTTNDYLDAWLVGFTEQLATASWVGFETPREMRGILGYRSISGGTLPAQIWADYMTVALDGSEPGELPDVRLRRYGLPACPPPPGEEVDEEKWEKQQKRYREDLKKWKKEAKKKREKDEEPPPPPEPPVPPREGPSPDDPMYDGFDANRFTLRTGTDGDSFLDGHQAERCVPQGSEEEYGPLR